MAVQNRLKMSIKNIELAELKSVDDGELTKMAYSLPHFYGVKGIQIGIL